MFIARLFMNIGEGRFRDLDGQLLISVYLGGNPR
jgi:hypothetical protein